MIKTEPLKLAGITHGFFTREGGYSTGIFSSLNCGLAPKLRQLIGDLEAAGFVNRGGKGSHRNYVHPKVVKPVTISGGTGDDAKRYQIRATQLAIEESRK